MSLPTQQRLYEVLERTWPHAGAYRAGPWTMRDGAGGGKRVSATTADGAFTVKDLALAEAKAAGLNQTPLFFLRDGEAELDAMLEQSGYSIIDPVTLYAAPIDEIAQKPPPVSTFVVWPPLAIMADLWAECGIARERVDVMHRATQPKTGLLARITDQPAGAAFVSIDQDIAMIHAMVVLPRFRRQGAARNMLRGAACWAQDHGATSLTLAVTTANTAANALYASLGMQVVGHYHYRIK